jgi:hypothetical protein
LSDEHQLQRQPDLPRRLVVRDQPVTACSDTIERDDRIGARTRPERDRQELIVARHLSPGAGEAVTRPSARTAPVRIWRIAGESMSAMIRRALGAPNEVRRSGRPPLSGPSHVAARDERAGALDEPIRWAGIAMIEGHRGARR